MKQFRVKNLRTDEVIVPRASLAADPFNRMRGLLGKASLSPGEGIILQPASSIHTLFMRFAIDVIYLDEKGAIKKVVPNLVPFRFSWARGSHTVIEVPSGATRVLDLIPGDRLDWEADPSSDGAA